MALPLFVAAAAFKGIEAGLNFIGGRRAGAAARRQGEMERAIYGHNAELAEAQADDAIARGQDASNRQLFKMRTTLGAQSAGFAGQGVSVVGGSPEEVIRSDQSIGEADRLTMIENARREAWGYRQQATQYRMRGDLAYQAARNRQSAANWESIGSLANFGGDLFDMYKGYTS